MNKAIELTWEEWVDQFKPIANHLDQDASMDGYMFETYGPEQDFALQPQRVQERKVWTLVDWGDGQAIYQGPHLVNRMGYLITENPYEPDTQYIADKHIFGEED